MSLMFLVKEVRLYKKCSHYPTELDSPMWHIDVTTISSSSQHAHFCIQLYNAFQTSTRLFQHLLKSNSKSVEG